MSGDLTCLVGEQIECLHSQPGTWEVVDSKDRVAEGPFVKDPDLDTIFRTNDEVYKLATEITNR